MLVLRYNDRSALSKRGITAVLGHTTKHPVLIEWFLHEVTQRTMQPASLIIARLPGGNQHSKARMNLRYRRFMRRKASSFLQALFLKALVDKHGD